MRWDVISLFPNFFRGPLDESILKRARQKGIFEVHLHDIRDFSKDKHKRVDDRPFGGGPGMVLMAEPVYDAVESVRTPQAKVIYLSPQGVPLTAKLAREMSGETHLILLCGHYEGIDERAIDTVDMEVSIGDYVLTNGCLPALVLIDAVSRFIPGVLGDDRAANQDSFEEDLLDCPHFTRPTEFQGKQVPEVLLSGDHQKIKAWRKQASLEKTKRVRPDLLKRKNHE